MTEVRSFRDLDVYRRAYRLSLDVHKATLGFPKVEQYALGDQMRRASKSVCANIAEGFGRQRTSPADFKRFLVMASGSCDEMQVWSDYGRDLGYLEAETAKAWLSEYIELARMLHGLMAKWRPRSDF
jgi:four helix bundle protein